jgi:hypothetical protein
MRRRRRGSLIAALVVPACALSACSLLTSTNGLSDGIDVDGGRETTAGEGGSEAAPSDDGGDGGGPVDGADAAPTASALYASAVLADKPVGYWRLEELGGATAKDETAHHDGQYLAGPLLDQPGIAGSRAMKLPKGMHARVLVPSTAYRFPGNAAYSVELWVKAGELKDYQWLAGTESYLSGRSGWSLLADASGRFRYEVWVPPADGGDNQVRGAAVATTPITAGTFRHVVVTYSGTTIVGYLDGVKTNMFTTSGQAPDTGQLLWACRNDLEGCLDDWTIDELAIYDVALGADRVKAHFDLGK